MLRKKIEELRETLDDMITRGCRYEEIYQVSLELDKYIALYYQSLSEI